MLKTNTANIPAKSLLNPTKILYLFLAIAGSIAPWFWVLQNPAAFMSPTLFLQEAFENNVAAAHASDLWISAIAFFYFAWVELKRLEVSRLWILLYVGLTFGIGVSCALPCFLYHRAQILEKNTFR